MEINVKRLRELLAAIGLAHSEHGSAGQRLDAAYDAMDFLIDHGDDLLRVYEAWQAAPVAPITEQVSFPLGGRIPLNFDEPCFKTTHARIVTCDAEGRPVADSALTINPDEIDSRLIVEDSSEGCDGCG